MKTAKKKDLDHRKLIFWMLFLYNKKSYNKNWKKMENGKLNESLRSDAKSPLLCTRFYTLYLNRYLKSLVR